MTFPKFLTRVNRNIPIEQNRVYLECLDGKFYLKTDILPGDFILKNGRFSASTKFAQERGIFIGKDNKFIELSSLSDKVYNKIEVFDILQGDIDDLPTENDIQAINNAVWAIDNSLNQIGLPQFKFAQTFADDFWSQESIRHSSTTEKRHFFLVKTAENISTISSDNHKISGLVTERKTLYVGSDVLIVRTSSSDTYWVLQSIARNCFCILSRLNNCPQKCRNKDHGIVFYEDSQLIVENPVDNVYFNGNEKELSTIKEHFRKSSSGLYAKVGESYGHWKL